MRSFKICHIKGLRQEARKLLITSAFDKEYNEYSWLNYSSLFDLEINLTELEMIPTD